MASPTQLPGLPAGAADPCVHCGFCLPTCASYRVLASEMDSPRGRIHALRAIEAGDLELDATVASHFDTCLGCYACVSACPSGVRYDQLIEATRPKLNQANQRSSWQTSFRKLLLQVLPYPKRLRALLQPLRAYAGTPLQRISGWAGVISSQVANPANPAPSSCISAMAWAGTSFARCPPNRSVNEIMKYFTPLSWANLARSVAICCVSLF